MSKDLLRELREGEAFRSFSFHVKGILDAQHSVKKLLAELETMMKSDLDKSASLLSNLEVELRDHIPYHLREAGKPLYSLLRRAYEELGNYESELEALADLESESD